MGDVVCPSGYVYINDFDECNNARLQLGIKQWNGNNLNTHNHRLPYCWVGQSGKANFNEYGDVGSNPSLSVLICTLGNGCHCIWRVSNKIKPARDAY